MQRRLFLTHAARSVGLLAAGRSGALAALCTEPRAVQNGVPGTPTPNTLRLPTNVSARALTLTAAPTRADIGGSTTRAWTFNGELPGPTIRARRGETARVALHNQLAEDSIVHWHGLHVPEQFDGHPRLAIAAGRTFAYEFVVDQRAGTYWYHPHAHHRTAPQVYMGLAGLFLVSDAEEDALGLPSGRYELPLVLRDARVDGGELSYAGPMRDVMTGLLGDTVLANGVMNASAAVDRAVYRLRILNGSNARIFNLALSTGAPFTIMGNDGGLLDAPERVRSTLLAPGERLDVLVDFRDGRPGDRVMLRSAPFSIPAAPGMGMGRGMGPGMGGMGRGMAGLPQGVPMDLIEFRLDGPVIERRPLPARLSSVPVLTDAGAVARRTFVFESSMMVHTINGREFELERVDVRVPIGRTERWSFVNDSNVPHPVHLHATHFQVVGRSGVRSGVTPAERGLKDTVLVLPGERVDVLVRFDRHRGLFLLHCHNLEHEDAGMMANVLVG